MSNDLRVTISAQDNASAVFDRVGDSATQMGAAIERSAESSSGLARLADEARALDSELQTVGATMMGVGATITAVVAAPMALGTKAAIDQVRAVQQATVALRAYEQDASKVEQVLSELVAYARSDMGVLFQREDLFAAAQGLKVMGAETENLVEYVEIMSRSVGLGAVSWDELGRVIGRVLATGRLAGNEFDELTKAGFQLDDSLRNTTITAEELFEALDKGIPADAMAGQVATIDGQLIRLRSGIRELGLAFLQVDRDTSQFIEGGLGAQLADSIGQAREVMLSMAPAAAAFGQVAAGIAENAGRLVTVFLSLPQPIQTALTATTLISGGLLTMGGALLLAIPRVVAFGQALATIRASQTIMGLASVAGRFTAIGLAAGVATVAITQTYDRTRDMVQAAEDLDGAIRNLQLSGLDDPANAVQDVRAEINALIDDLESGNFDWLPFVTGGVTVPQEVKANISSVLKEAVEDSRVDYEQFFAWIAAEIARIGNDDEAKIEFLNELSDPDILVDFRREVDATGDAVDAAAEAQKRWNDSVAHGIRFSDEFLDSLLGSDDALDRLDERYAALAERQREFIASGMAIMGMDDPLSQWDLAGNASDAAMLANSLTDAGTAAETVFRVIVGNTNAIKSQADATLQWAESLIAARGEWSRLDELVSAGLITGESGVFDDGSQYAEAQNAFDSIAESVGRITDNMDALQAIQAPLIADMTASTAAYTDELLAMEPAAQLVALAWMDSATSAKAMEIATLGASAAAGELGVEGEAAFAAMVEGAAQADPVLKALLIDMGIISEGADGTITIHTDGLESAQTTLSDINTTLSHMIDILDNGVLDRSYTLEIGADISEAEARIAAFSDYEIPQPVVSVDADTGAATSSLNAFEEEASAPISKPITLDWTSAGSSVGDSIAGGLGMVGDIVSITVTQTGVEETNAALQSVTDTAATIPELEVLTVSVFGAYEGASALDTVTASAQAIPEAEMLNVFIFGAYEGATALDTVTAAAQGIPEAEMVNVFVFGAYEAAAALYGVRDAAYSIPESVSTTVTTNRVTNWQNNYLPGTSIMPGGRHGGIPGYASGGVLFEGAEAGYETLHLAGGGIVPLMNRGIYEGPVGSYVSPHNAQGGMNFGGISVNVNVSGNVYGIDDLTETVMREMTPALEAASRRQARAMGGLA